MFGTTIPSECDEEEFLQSEKLEKIVDMFVESGHGHPIHSETLQFLLKGERRREDEKKVFRNVRMLNIPLKAQGLKVSEKDEKYEPQTFSQEDAITHPLSEQKEKQRRLERMFEDSYGGDILPERIASCFERFELPLLNIGVDSANRKVDSLADTGASHCVTNIRFLRSFMSETEVEARLNTKVPRPRFYMADASISEPLGQIVLELFMGGDIIKQKFWVMKETTSDIILGNSLFIPKRMTISYDRHEVYWKTNQGNAICPFGKKLAKFTRDHVSPPTILSSSVEGWVPPMSAAYVPVRVDNGEHLSSESDYFGLVRPLDIQAPAQYRSASGPCRLRHGKGYVVIMNTGSTGLHVYPGLPVSELHLANRDDFR